MAGSPKILAFAGSARKDSFNKKILRTAVAGAKEAGGDVTVIDLKDYPLPLFDEDLEAAEGAPANAVKLKKLFIEHDALLIASPEYNSSFTPLLKNTFDWVSRAAPGEAPLAGFDGKLAALISASPGGLGGLRGLVHVRALLNNIGVVVLPAQVSVPTAHEALAADGSLKDARLSAKLEALGRELVEVTKKLKA